MVESLAWLEMAYSSSVTIGKSVSGWHDIEGPIRRVYLLSLGCFGIIAGHFRYLECLSHGTPQSNLLLRDDFFTLRLHF